MVGEFVESRRNYLKRQVQQRRTDIDEIESAAQSMEHFGGNDILSTQRRVRDLTQVALARLSGDTAYRDAENELAAYESAVTSRRKSRKQI